MKDTDLAYFAGIFDGEGNVTLGRLNTHGQRAFPSYRVAIYVGNTNLEMLQWIRSIFGGYITSRKPAPGRKLMHQWSITSALATDILRAALPWLIVKRERVELALRFQSETHQGKFRSQEDRLSYHRRRDVLAQEMRRLNVRGVSQGVS